MPPCYFVSSIHNTKTLCNTLGQCPQNLHPYNNWDMQPSPCYSRKCMATHTASYGHCIARWHHRASGNKEWGKTIVGGVCEFLVFTCRPSWPHTFYFLLWFLTTFASSFSSLFLQWSHCLLLPLFLPFWLLLLSNTVVHEFQWGVMIVAQLAKVNHPWCGLDVDLCCPCRDCWLIVVGHI
jgi:hypothetical protein